MSECVLDGVPTPVDSACKTWDGLLADLDRRLSAEGRAVTVVRFGGVDQPSFREADRAGQDLAVISRIDVESLDVRSLLRKTVGVAEDGLAVLAGGSRRVAEAL